MMKVPAKGEEADKVGPGDPGDLGGPVHLGCAGRALAMVDRHFGHSEPRGVDSGAELPPEALRQDARIAA